MINSLHSSDPTSGRNILRTFKEDDKFAPGVLFPKGEVSQTYKIMAGEFDMRVTSSFIYNKD